MSPGYFAALVTEVQCNIYVKVHTHTHTHTHTRVCVCVCERERERERERETDRQTDRQTDRYKRKTVVTDERGRKEMFYLTTHSTYFIY